MYTIIKHYSGSHAYGTATPSSDVDIRGVFVNDFTEFCNPFYPVDQITDSTEEDCVLFELDKFVTLASKGNPNVIESLWIDSSNIIQEYEELYSILKEMRNETLHKQTISAHLGYAKSQLARINGHSKRISNPQPKRRPQMRDFVKVVVGLMKPEWETSSLFIRLHGPYFTIGHAPDRTLYQEDGSMNITRNHKDPHRLITNVNNGTPIFFYDEDSYTKAVNDWKAYWDWKNKRNKKRQDLEVEHGYDTKHAMHLIRLCCVAKQICSKGKLSVRRPEYQLLNDIRNGKFTLDEVKEMSEDITNEIDDRHLPDGPNLSVCANVCLNIREFIKTNES